MAKRNPPGYQSPNKEQPLKRTLERTRKDIRNPVKKSKSRRKKK